MLIVSNYILFFLPVYAVCITTSCYIIYACCCLDAGIKYPTYFFKNGAAPLRPQLHSFAGHKKIIAVLSLLFFVHADAQDFPFLKLSTIDGLSDNKVNIARLDKNGLLWIGTVNGLNCFDGYAIKKYFREDHPEMCSNNITNILCDAENRLWITFSGGGACMLDENRNFKKVVPEHNGATEQYFYTIQTLAGGVLLKSGSRLYKMKKGTESAFEKIEWQEDPVIGHPFTKWSRWDSSHVAFIGANRFVLFDALKLKVETDLFIQGISGAESINEEEMLITVENGGPLYRYSFTQKKIIKEYSGLKDQYGIAVNSSLRGIGKLHDGRFIITSGYAGVYIFNPVNEQLLRYAHDPFNSRSISADNTYYVITDTSGYFFITTNTAGLNYFNTRQPIAGYLSVFSDALTGRAFDGFISSIAEDRDGVIWLGTQSRLIKWEKSTGKSWFYDFGKANNTSLSGNENVRALYFDETGKLWVGTSRFGIIILDKNKHPVKYVSTVKNTNTTGMSSAGLVQQIVASGFNNDIWVATNSGLRVYDINGVLKCMDENPLFKRLEEKFCFSVWFTNHNEVWAGTTEGAFRYRFRENTLDSFNTKNGKLPDNSAICFASDNESNIFIGTANGLTRLSASGEIKNYTKGMGLQHGQCESIIADNEGSIWIANTTCLLKFMPKKELFQVYDERFGLTNSGFKETAVLMCSDGELLYGSNKGINHFKPEKLHLAEAPLKVMITSCTAGNSNLYSTKPQQHLLSYSNNTLFFSFSAIDLYGSNNIRYQYRLGGADTSWIGTNIPRQVIYSKLPPGKYLFEVRAARYGADWVSASNPVSVQIETPWWNTFWFIASVSLSLAAIAAYNIFRRSKKIKQQKEALETEKAINWFATSLNEKNTVEDILWDVSRNCISRLNFEDCVIYLTDNERKVLIQKAAWGPKTTDENKILKPIEIPFGKGISGAVAETGFAEIVGDTSKDGRYIVDDAVRSSEICVPIIAGGHVLGVIDSENSRKNFFNQRHLSILSTIASLCAVKILRAITEAEKNRVHQELQYLEQRASATEMLALRAQMNPHFMFNSLNSINNFILKSDTEKASEYLTRFSQLMRMILDNSRQDWVLLENELRALQLYIDLEAVRLKNAFTFRLLIDEQVNPAAEQVPPMLIQPYVENAIWHGLLHRQNPGGVLLLHIANLNGNLQIRVEDNGVGRQESALLKSKFQSHKKSHGMQITAERIDIINRTYQVQISVSISDIYHNNTIAGTSVLLEIKRKAGLKQYQQ